MLTFGKVIRILMNRRGLTGRQLSEKIGISPTSVSKILTDQSKPRQITLTRLIKTLCKDPEEEQMVVRGFTGAELLKEEPSRPLPTDEQLERERAERFLEVKAQSIAFKKSVARELDKIGVKYTQDYCEGIYVTDFLIEKDGKRIALECKFNVQRDFEKAVMIAKILKEQFTLDAVYIVIPFTTETIQDPCVIGLNDVLTQLERGQEQTFQETKS
ncbi:MAG: helix-turn-helix domain-containing protein [Lentisphaerae bacterium]|nr:helix-turn-helix domain-containing protein [Lentisphaerota bacterium]